MKINKLTIKLNSHTVYNDRTFCSMFEINADDMNLTDLRFCFVCGHIVSDKNVNKCEKCGSHYIFKI